jgi:hypothetical protein
MQEIVAIDRSVESRAQRWAGYAVLGCCLTVYWAAVAILVHQCKAANGGHFIYPLDDAYIHLSVAKNFAHFGIWGVTRFRFGGCSSSLLWPMMLAGIMKITGSAAEMAPLYLSTVAGSILLLSIYVIAGLQRASTAIIAICLLAVIFATPLPTLTITGMEHVCQASIDLWLVYLFAKAATSRGKLSSASVCWLMVLSALATMVRYEGGFLIAVGAIVLVVRRRGYAAVASAIAGVVPIAIVGIISIRHGGSWLPNSVLLKGNRPQFGGPHGIAGALGYDAVYTLYFNAPWLFRLAVLAICTLLLRLRRKPIDRVSAMLIIVLGVVVLHCQYAAVGWFFRYESYLIVLLLVPLTLSLKRLTWPRTRDEFSSAAAIIVAACLVAWPFEERTVMAFRATPLASRNIYEQQYQMAKFIREYYPNSPAAVNDIGAVSFYSDINLLDIYGLDDHGIMLQKLSHTYSCRSVADAVRQRGVKIAIIYDDFLLPYGGTPANWTRVGIWQLSDNEACGSDTLAFYSTDPAATTDLRSRLAKFSKGLPKSSSYKVY